MGIEAGEVLGTGRNHIIKRPRLTRLLDETDARIILLIAPAGYGKTTLAREWLANRPHGWYRGTSASADVAALALGLARACSALVPDVGRRLKSRLAIPHPPGADPTRLADLLAQDLNAWPSEAWVCFDDYHFACDSAPAEQFVEHLLFSSDLRLLVTSRSRPKWAATRRVLYGEVFEVGRNLLAMNHAEAECILSKRSSSEADGFFSLTDGWPVLLGLATQPIGVDLPGSAAPEELFTTFAQELYVTASSDVQRALRQLALAPFVNADIAETLIGEQFQNVLDSGVELGFLAGTGERLEFHPLLRLFLAAKFRKSRDDPAGERIAKLADILIELEEWDAVFELAARFADEELLMKLLETSLATMLGQARLPTLARWATAAKSSGVDSPVLDFADAELAFRRGELAKAEALASQSARGFDDGSSFKSRALWIAGTSAHLTYNDELSLQHFKAASAASLNRHDAQHALWGEFLASESLERENEAAVLLERLVATSGRSVDDLLRIATGQFRLATVQGNIKSVLEAQHYLTHLVDRSRDSLIRTSFLNMRAHLLVLAGRYEEALGSVCTEVAFASDSALDFVLPFAYLLRAGANLGLRQFRPARGDLTNCERTAMQNEFVMSNFWSLQARLRLATQQLDEALQILTRSYVIARGCQAAHAEHLAWWSLAHALMGNDSTALDLAHRAQIDTGRIEVSALVPWTKAVLAVRKNRHASRIVHEAFSTTVRSGNVDAFVATYRACPEILGLLMRNPSNLEELKGILELAHDQGLARRVGLLLDIEPRAGGSSILSDREREVLDLVSQGLTNKEIGRTLYITESTVKVHVRKICTKLGVRSRTEAATRAAEMSD